MNKAYIMSLIKYRSINSDILENAKKIKSEVNKKWTRNEWKYLYGEAIACKIEAFNIHEAFQKAAKEFNLKSEEFVIYDILS